MNKYMRFAMGVVVAAGMSACDTIKDSLEDDAVDNSINASDQGVSVNTSSVSQTTLTPSSSNTGSPTAPETQVSMKSILGMAIKGPLVAASVDAYVLDTTQADFKGELIGQGYTDETASLQLSIAEDVLAGHSLLLEYHSGKELNGSTPVIPVLRTVITAQQIADNTPVYATPLTTLSLDYAAVVADEQQTESVSQKASTGIVGNKDGQISSQEFDAALETAKSYVLGFFGPGLEVDGIDPFTDAPVLSDSTAQGDSLNYRTSIELLSAVVEKIMAESNQRGKPISSDKMLKAIAKDIADGRINGSLDAAVIADLEVIDANTLQQIVETEPESLKVPGTDVALTDINTVLTSEAQIIAPEVAVEVVASPVISAIDIDYGVEDTGVNVYYSLTNDFSNAVPLNNDEVLPQQTVYFFFTAPDLERTTVYCCKGVQGDASGESHSPSKTIIGSAAGFAVDLTQFSTQGTRELYFDWRDSTGAVHTNNFWNFAIDVSTVSTAEMVASAPTVSTNPEPVINEPIGNTVPVVEEPIAEESVPEPVVPEVAVVEEPDPVVIEPIVEQPVAPVDPEPVTPVDINVTLSWDIPTQRENGDPLPLAEISGYEIYYFKDGSSVEQGEIMMVSASDNQGNPLQNMNITINEVGTWHFAISAYDNQNLYSEMSTPVSAVLAQ